MSLNIDPKALQAFAVQAVGHSSDLRTVHLDIALPPHVLGEFEEATDLVQAINGQTDEVNQRLQATSDALKYLALAADAAAKLSNASDEDITKQMKQINHQIDDARRKLTPTTT